MSRLSVKDIGTAALFAGTTEGRLLAERLAGGPVKVHVFVATEYGGEGLPQAENILCPVAMTTRPLSFAISSMASSGFFPLTKIRHTMSSISAVLMTCGLHSPVSRMEWSLENASTSLIMSEPQALRTSTSK